MADTAASLGEFGRISAFFAPLASGAPGALGLKDDAARLSVEPGYELIITADALVEGVHFLPSDPPDLIARKLLRTNLSDLAAKGAKPAGYLLTMALPARCDDRWVERFAAGLAQDQAEFGIHLLGGDSVSTPGPITLSVTAFGSGKAGDAPQRSGAKPGDLIFVSGTIGDGALGLLAATAKLASIEFDHQNYLRDRYQLPQPRLALGRALVGHVSAMMDISDGLVADLQHLCAASNVAGVIEAVKIPVSDAAAAALAADLDLFDLVLGGGDDYELLFTAPTGAAEAINSAAEASGTMVTVIGQISDGENVCIRDREGHDIQVMRRGFTHI